MSLGKSGNVSFFKEKVIWYYFKNFSVIFLLFRKKGVRKVL